MIQRMPRGWPAVLGPVWRWVDRNYRRVRRTLVGLGDARRIRREGLTMIPPARLRDRVHGKPDIDSFLFTGERTRNRLASVLDRCGRTLEEFERMLDFGCGCGRVLRWLEPLRDRCDLHGTDVDRKAVAWCADHIPFARFQVNDALPPLAYEAGSFDLVYSISVLTHLDEERARLWLEELRRVTRPGGLVILSVLGEGSRRTLREHERAHLAEQGILHLRTGRWRGMFPDWYQVTVYTPDHARTLFTRVFDLVEYIPGGLTKQQDLVVLRRSAPAPCSSAP